MNQSPYGLMVKGNGSVGIAAMGNVPVVSMYGFVLLALAVLVGGSLVIRNRAAVR